MYFGACQAAKQTWVWVGIPPERGLLHHSLKKRAELLLFLSVCRMWSVVIRPDAAFKLQGANISADCLLERLSPKGDQWTHRNDSIDSAINISVLEESPASSFMPRWHEEDWSPWTGEKSSLYQLDSQAMSYLCGQILPMLFTLEAYLHEQNKQDSLIEDRRIICFMTHAQGLPTLKEMGVYIDLSAWVKAQPPPGASDA